MKRSFLLAGFVLSLLMGALVSPFASSHPDGLEKVAEDKEFIQLAEETPAAWSNSPAPDYQVTLFRNDSLATSFAGLLGTILVCVIGVALGKILLQRREFKQ